METEEHLTNPARHFVKDNFFVHDGPTNFLAEVTPAIMKELSKLYTNEERGRRHRLWPSGKKANFTIAFDKSGLVMRGVCFDLNTIGIWYHAGFPVHARIAYARYTCSTSFWRAKTASYLHLCDST